MAGREANVGSATGAQPPLRHLLRALRVVLTVVAIAALISVFVERVYEIPSGSMESTLHGCSGCDNDRVLVDKVTYRFSEPVRGDVVVFARPASWTNTELQLAPEPGNPVAAGLGKLVSLLGVQPAGETDMVKRVIAVSGQTVACCDSRNRVTVDGRPLDESYVYYAPELGVARQAPFEAVRVPDGQLWLMGDSRNDSLDSRAAGNGPVPVTDVIGKARLVVAPLARFGGIAGPDSRVSASRVTR